MLNNLKNITQSKSFHICVIIIIITIILFIVGMLVLRYNVEGETNMPFELTKIAIISSQEGIENGEEGTKWSFDVNQSNDIYIYINKNNKYDKLEVIKEIVIDNFKIEGNNNENIKIYKPEKNEENVIFKYSDENIVQSLEYKGDIKDNIKDLKISNQGGIIAFRCSNNCVTKYKSDEEEIKHSELLKKANIEEETLKFKLSFDINICLESGKKYNATINLDLPVENVIEEGTSKIEITDLSNVVFKRINN